MMKVNFRSISLLVIALCCTFSVSAQSFEEYVRAQRASFEEYVEKQDSEFKAYRDKMNAEYAEILSKTWERFNSTEPIVQKLRPEPIDPVIAEPDVQITNDPLLVEKIIIPPSTSAPKSPKPMVERPEKKPVVAAVPTPTIDPLKVQEYDPTPVPTLNMDFESLPDDAPDQVEVAEAAPKSAPKSSKPVNSGFAFDYYGTKCYMSINESHRFALSKINERAVSKSWSTLSEDRYTQIILDALDWRDYLQLGDWGYVRFVELFTESFFGPSHLNEARVMQMFILIQSGYEARIARGDSGLVLMLPFTSDVYGYLYLEIKGERYYVMDRNPKGGSYSIFNHKFPNEQRLSLNLGVEPRLEMVSTPLRRLTSKRYQTLSAELSTNENLINFYGDVPRNSSWSAYSHASLSSEVKKDLYPMFKSQIEGKSESVAANMLLNFVQTAFDYKTDGEQFGAERPLFGDESIYYPYCDCEDRSILYSILVRDLLGLDVVLLSYPNHIATAVCFKDSVKGDYLTIDGKKYLVCDPTFIGAQIGRTMPQFKSVSATVIRL